MSEGIKQLKITITIDASTAQAEAIKFTNFLSRRFAQATQGGMKLAGFVDFKDVMSQLQLVSKEIDKIADKARKAGGVNISGAGKGSGAGTSGAKGSRDFTFYENLNMQNEREQAALDAKLKQIIKAESKARAATAEAERKAQEALRKEQGYTHYNVAGVPTKIPGRHFIEDLRKQLQERIKAAPPIADAFRTTGISPETIKGYKLSETALKSFTNSYKALLDSINSGDPLTKKQIDTLSRFAQKFKEVDDAVKKLGVDLNALQGGNYQNTIRNIIGKEISPPEAKVYSKLQGKEYVQQFMRDRLTRAANLPEGSPELKQTLDLMNTIKARHPELKRTIDDVAGQFPRLAAILKLEQAMEKESIKLTVELSQLIKLLGLPGDAATMGKWQKLNETWKLSSNEIKKLINYVEKYNEILSTLTTRLQTTKGLSPEQAAVKAKTIIDRHVPAKESNIIFKKMTYPELAGLPTEGINYILNKAPEIKQALGGMADGFGKYHSTFSKFTESVKGYMKFQLEWFAGAGLIFATLGAIRNVISQSMNFIQTLHDMAAIAGEAKANIGLLSDAAQRVSRETPYSANEVAKMGLQLIRAGMSAKQAAEAMDTVAKVATISGEDVKLIADTVATATMAWKDYGLTTEQIGQTIAASLNLSRLTVEDLGTAFNYMAGVASSFNHSFEETNAILAVYSNLGVRASTIATGWVQLMSELIAPSKKASEYIAGLTNASTQLNMSFNDLDPTTHKFWEILKTLEDAGFSAAKALDILEVRAGRALIFALRAGSEEFRKMEERIETTKTLNESLEVAMSGPIKAFRQLWNVISMSGIAIGKNLVPAIQAATYVLRIMAGVLFHAISFWVSWPGLIIAVISAMLIFRGIWNQIAAIGIATMMADIGAAITLVGRALWAFNFTLAATKELLTAIRLLMSTNVLGIILTIVALVAGPALINWLTGDDTNKKLKETGEQLDKNNEELNNMKKSAMGVNAGMEGMIDTTRAFNDELENLRRLDLSEALKIATDPNPILDAAKQKLEELRKEVKKLKDEANINPPPAPTVAFIEKEVPFSVTAKPMPHISTFSGINIPLIKEQKEYEQQQIVVNKLIEERARKEAESILKVAEAKKEWAKTGITINEAMGIYIKQSEAIDKLYGKEEQSLERQVRIRELQNALSQTYLKILQQEEKSAKKRDDILKEQFDHEIKLMEQAAQEKLQIIDHTHNIQKMKDDDELASFKSKIGIQQDLLQQYYQQNMISADKYYEEMERLQRTSTDKEIEILNKNLDRTLAKNNTQINELKKQQSTLYEQRGTTYGENLTKKDETEIINKNIEDFKKLSNEMLKIENNSAEAVGQHTNQVNVLTRATEEYIAKLQLQSAIEKATKSLQQDQDILNLQKEQSQVLIEANELIGDYHEAQKEKIKLLEIERDRANKNLDIQEATTKEKIKAKPDPKMLSYLEEELRLIEAIREATEKKNQEQIRREQLMSTAVGQALLAMEDLQDKINKEMETWVYDITTIFAEGLRDALSNLLSDAMKGFPEQQKAKKEIEGLEGQKGYTVSEMGDIEKQIEYLNKQKELLEKSFEEGRMNEDTYFSRMSDLNQELNEMNQKWREGQNEIRKYNEEIEKAKEGLTGWLEYFNKIFDAIQKKITDLIADQVIDLLLNLGMKFVTGALGGGASTGTGASFTASSTFGEGLTNLKIRHQGGLIMHEGGEVPSLKTILPTFHAGGLNSDEVPAILQKKERVLSIEQNQWVTDLVGALSKKEAGQGDTYVYITANDAKSFEDMVERNPNAIMKVINSSGRRNGAFRRTMQTTF